MPQDQPLKIVHCIRAPVGGVFRHVADLATAQYEAGHEVGLICDSITGGAFEDQRIAELSKVLALGVTRIPMRRAVSPGDLMAAWRVSREIRRMAPDVLHAHGAKGGLYARMIGTLARIGGAKVSRFYCPHGGSLHYDPKSLQGRVYFAAERIMERMTDGLVFVSEFEAATYRAKVGAPRIPTRVINNGLRPEEFEPVVPDEDAADFLFIGTLRDLKGPDVFIKALGRLHEAGAVRPSAVIVGDGEDEATCKALVAELGLADSVRFMGPMPAREAFTLARAVVIPSRAESLPYIVLETIAARLPILTTNVGGIPEIFGTESDRLVAPGDDAALAAAMAGLLRQPDEAMHAATARAERLRQRFSLAVMASKVEGFYREVARRPALAPTSGEAKNVAGHQMFIRQ